MGAKILLTLGLALSAIQAFGAVYYVATDGSDSAAGTKEKPFATLNKANKVVIAGDTVWIRGGIYDLHDTVFYARYKMTAGILLTASGESDDNRIHYLLILALCEFWEDKSMHLVFIEEIIWSVFIHPIFHSL